VGFANLIPDFKPVYSEMFVATNGDIWTWLEPRLKMNWFVMDEEGNALRRVKAPEGVRLTHADANRVYGINIDEASVVVFELD